MHQLVSVIIPTYNSSATIEATIKSVLKQTYKNIEIIVVDDCSSDFVLLEKIVGSLNTGQIKLYRQPRNLNGAAARNKGVELSSGDVICFLDSDDLWLDDKIYKQMKVFRQGCVVTCKTATSFRGEKLSLLPVKSEYDTTLTGFNNLFGSLEHNLVFQTSSILMSKSDFFYIGGFDEELYRHQDYQLVYSIDKSNLEVLFVDEVLSYYIKDERTAIQKGWSMDRTRLFLEKYSDGFEKEELANFLVVQLLGPVIKSNNLHQWFKLLIDLDIKLSMAFYKTALYLYNRLLK
ncbi:glycosyltransferase family 2 protein [Vibrio parahaemolyticus]|nr:glycosyltransferase family 2 protein [Vibrio parahaemolyticus]EJC6849067.1 glycosyltransferase family 2 protein [Vibrio parahaemolyticus]EJC7136387.1 glycosyltransferase family 2 protein [Vibrio parahaemolyticus]EKG9569042.1 glycosyltransferase family 2 protein [Vibrio parahaemolyticus]EKG9571790.1 glycosyltransferase family 2 protein [Vibrio parahaemolyticus]